MKLATVRYKGYEQVAISHPDLLAAFEDYMIARGHQRASPAIDADLVIFDMDVCPETLPFDWGLLDVILQRGTPVCFVENWDHASGGLWAGQHDWEYAREAKGRDWARFCYAASRPPRKIMFFKRKMEWHPAQPYPTWVFPLEYPLFADYPLVSKDELFSRPYDLCMMANLSPIRKKAFDCLKMDDRLNVLGGIVMSDNRYPYEEWVNFHRQAKMFVEADASLGSERPMWLMTVAPMLRIKSDHRLPFPRKDMVHQVVIGDYHGFVSREDCDKIISVVRDADRLYSIYVAGAEHMRKHYSMAARCSYMAETVENFMQGENK